MPAPSPTLAPLRSGASAADDAARRAPSALAFARRTFAQAARGAVLWGYVFGAFVASSALTYHRFYPTAASRLRLEVTFAHQQSVAALFGPLRDLQTVAGFTAYKTLLTSAVLGGVWGVLTGTRLTRGEEDAGRWELLVGAGPLNGRRATAWAVAAMEAAVLPMLALATGIAILAGQAGGVGIGPRPAAFLALSLVATPVWALALGALAGQVAATRRQASGLAAGVLGVSYAVRMAGDASRGLSWLVWCSPLGWVERLRPLTGSDAWPLLLVASWALGCTGAAVVLAGRRDLAAGLLTESEGAEGDRRLLSGTAALTLRLTAGSALSWAMALSTGSAMFGLVAKSSARSGTGSVTQVLDRLGAGGSGVRAMLGVSLLIVAIALACEAAGLVGAARAEEADGRLDHLLIAPVHRLSWYAGRVGTATAVLVLTGAASGAAAWAASAGQRSGAGLATMVAAGVSLSAPAVCTLGVGAAAIGWAPRLASGVAYALVAWSGLLDVAAGFTNESRWLADTSLFHLVALAPAAPPHWAACGIMAGVGLAGAVAGAWRFGRRDLQSA